MSNISSILVHKEYICNKSLIKVILVTSFVIMTCLGAYVRIPLPFTPVPITLQTFFVILSGALLGRKLGTLSQASYLALGVLGMPVFQGYGAGLLHIAGPTGGYLLGFIVSAFLVGMLIEKSSRFFYTMLIMALGVASIYLWGILWLMVGYKFSLFKAISLGVIPFIPGAIIKLSLASFIYSKIKPRVDSLIK